MNRPNPVRQQMTVWAIVLGVWCVLVVVFAGQLVFNAGMSWHEGFRVAFFNWLPWALLSPIAVWLASVFPLERGHLRLSVPAHIAGCLLALLVCAMLRSLGPEPPGAFRGGPPGPRPGGPQEMPMDDAGPNSDMPMPAHFPPPRRDSQRFLHDAARRAQSDIPVYWVIVSIVNGFAISQRSRERERKALELEARLADARLHALRMQLHPHFLFNTLNAVSALVHKDAAAADEMIANLSELLRATLETSAQEIPLRRELEFLNRYLEIQQVRFGERLKVEKEIDASALEINVPTLILQPLVENAIKHGIEPHAETGVVQISARRTPGMLRLAVRNSGGAGEKAKPSTGIGLANTSARLQELYGGRARMVLNTDAAGKFSVDLEIPFNEDNEDSRAHSG